MASGAKSNFYLDVKQTALRADAHYSLAHTLYQEFLEADFKSDKRVTGFAGVALGGCHLASIVALYANIEGEEKPGYNVVYVRKEAKDHGTKNLVEGPKGGDHVILLEDVVTTGGSSIKACNQLKEAGYTVAGIIAIIDRRAKGERTEALDGVPLRALFTIDDFAV